MNKKILTITGLAIIASLIFSSCSNSDEVSYNENKWEIAEKALVMEKELAKKAEIENGLINNSNLEGKEMWEMFSYVDFTEEEFLKAKMDKKNIALFFHADWCPACVKLEKEINKNLSIMPDDSIVFNVNYDDSTKMKKMYWVTTQTSFIFLKDWSDEFTKKVWPSVDDIKTMLMN